MSTNRRRLYKTRGPQAHYIMMAPMGRVRELLRTRRARLGRPASLSSSTTPRHRISVKANIMHISRPTITIKRWSGHKSSHAIKTQFAKPSNYDQTRYGAQTATQSAARVSPMKHQPCSRWVPPTLG